MMYPDLVRQLLATQSPQAPQLQAGIPAQLPAPSPGYSSHVQVTPARHIEDVAPLALDEPAWTPYAGMSNEW